MQTLFTMLALAALSLVFHGASAEAQDPDDQVIVPTEMPAPPVAKIDTTRCNVDPAVVKQWIEGNDFTKALNQSYADISKNWEAFGEDNFGHDKSTDRLATKSRAKEVVDKQWEDLNTLAKTIVGNLNPACDKCKSLNTWGKLRYLVITRAITFDKAIIEEITQNQMDDNNVRVSLQIVLSLAELKARSRPMTTSDPGYSASQKQCQAELTKISRADPAKCNQITVGAYVDANLEKFRANLEAARKKSRPPGTPADKMTKLPTIECLGLTEVYGFVPYALAPLPF